MNIVEEALKNNILKNRWSDIEINLYFTGDLTKKRQTLLHNNPSRFKEAI